MKAQQYKRSEMTLHTHGVSALAAAVVRQWREDGRPKNSDIDTWSKIVYAHHQRMLEQSGAYKVEPRTAMRVRDFLRG